MGVQQIGEKVKATTKEIVNTISEEYEEGDYRSLSNSNVCAPWEELDLKNPQVEGEVREMIMNLSESHRHFTNALPDEDDFQLDLQDWVPVAMAALKKDDRLNRLRYELVPEKISEYCFWRNYFYRIMIIKKAYCTEESIQMPDGVPVTASKEDSGHVKIDLSHQAITLPTNVASSPAEQFYSPGIESEQNHAEKEIFEEIYDANDEEDGSINSWDMHDGGTFDDSILASDYYDMEDTENNLNSVSYGSRHDDNSSSALE
ncbi:synapse-associated protein of 47 kDa-like isoform X2 [Schistocerca gregaria]|nr:synapse-associated protein of 47 kDa-like isoform X2 [Schistocerca gregaria]